MKSRAVQNLEHMSATDSPQTKCEQDRLKLTNIINQQCEKHSCKVEKLKAIKESYDINKGKLRKNKNLQHDSGHDWLYFRDSTIQPIVAGYYSMFGRKIDKIEKRQRDLEEQAKNISGNTNFLA